MQPGKQTRQQVPTDQIQKKCVDELPSNPANNKGPLRYNYHSVAAEADIRRLTQEPQGS
jgi:hypothetical protein